MYATQGDAMASSIRTGVNFSVEGPTFTIFDMKGTVLNNGDWAVPFGFGSMLVQVDPAPLSGDILKVIADDRAAGDEGKIAYIGVTPYSALRLALEGVLTEEVLSASEETPDSITATVRLGGIEWKLVIKQGLHYGFATYDKNNEVV